MAKALCDKDVRASSNKSNNPNGLSSAEFESNVAQTQAQLQSDLHRSNFAPNGTLRNNERDLYCAAQMSRTMRFEHRPQMDQTQSHLSALAGASNTWLARRSAHLSSPSGNRQPTTVTVATTRTHPNGTSETMAQISESKRTNGRGSDKNRDDNDDDDDYYCVPERISQHYYQAPAQPMPQRPNGAQNGRPNQSQEPLIRSDSWQHKTRIDLSNGHGRAQTQRQALTWNPLEQANKQANDYYSVATLSLAANANESRAVQKQAQIYQQPANWHSLESSASTAKTTMLIADHPNCNFNERDRPTSFAVNGSCSPAPICTYANAFHSQPIDNSCAYFDPLSCADKFCLKQQSNSIAPQTTNKHKRNKLKGGQNGTKSGRQPFGRSSSTQCLALGALLLCATLALVCALVLNAGRNSQTAPSAARMNEPKSLGVAANATSSSQTTQNTQLMASSNAQIPIGNSAVNEFGLSRAFAARQSQLQREATAIRLHTNQTVPTTTTMTTIMTQWDRLWPGSDPTTAPTTATTTTTTTTKKPMKLQPEVGSSVHVLSVAGEASAPTSKHSYGPVEQQQATEPLSCLNGAQAERSKCLCARGFSGATCDIVGCPNECSSRGSCELRKGSTTNALLLSHSLASVDSFGFGQIQTTGAQVNECAAATDASADQSNGLRHFEAAASKLEDETSVWDNRLEWECKCEQGFAGPNCATQTELTCDNAIDDDNDGLVDCEDDDCCAQAACKDNLMCFKSPEPTQVLLAQASSNPFDHPAADWQPIGAEQTGSEAADSAQANDAFEQWRFLIANGSVQSYAQERAFERRRVAVVRGRVLKCSPASASSFSSSSSSGAFTTGDDSSVAAESCDGIVSVRVSVLEHTSAHFGFTLTRQDGYFDLLVNGDDWITLQFHRNAYAPLKLRVFARPKRINTLDEPVTLSLASSPASANSNSVAAASTRSLPFGLHLRTGLHAILGQIESPAILHAHRADVFACLWRKLHHSNRWIHSHEQPIVSVGRQSDDSRAAWRSFALASGTEAFRAQISATSSIAINYNSAAASEFARPSVTFELVSGSQTDEEAIKPLKLSSIEVQLSIEGQWKRAKLKPAPNLAYKFSWNRRNVYGQKVYGFGELIARFGYEYELDADLDAQQPETSSIAAQNNELLARQALNECIMQKAPIANAKLALIHQMSSLFAQAKSKRIVWFERRVFMEAFALNQHADIGRWTLAPLNRLDVGRDLIYFGAGWQLPVRLVYPLTLSATRSLAPTAPTSAQRRATRQQQQQNRYQFPVADATMIESSAANQSPSLSLPTPSRAMARGPNASVFVALTGRLMQLDGSGGSRSRLIDVPLAILMGKLNGQNQLQQLQEQASDIHLAYNSQQATLYISSLIGQRIVQVSYASLLALNKTLSGDTATLSAEDEINIEPLCGSKRIEPVSSFASVSCDQIRLIGPHSMSLDEHKQVLYFVDGRASIVALDLSNRLATLLWRPTVPKPQIAPNACNKLTWPTSEFYAEQVHSLTWMSADSSLYFVDRGSLFALRQDQSIELVAQSISATSMSANFTGNCNGGQSHSGATWLGRIETVSSDPANIDELLLVHRKSSRVQSSAGQRSNGNNSNATTNAYFVAKLRLGIGTKSKVALVDMHSAEIAWTSLVRRLSSALLDSSDLSSSTSAAPIDWQLVAASETGQSLPPLRRGAAPNDKQTLAGSGSRQIPFIHLALAGGFARLSSIEINSDGSIFVLDSIDHSISLLEPYSIQRTLLQRLAPTQAHWFAEASARLFGGQQQRPNLMPFTSGSDRRRIRPDIGYTNSNNNDNYNNAETNEDGGERVDSNDSNGAIIVVRNPITNERMEFHAGSGLQLSSSMDQLSWSRKLDFYYRIVAVSAASLGQQQQQQQQTDPIVSEDDRNDLDVRRVLARYLRNKFDSFALAPLASQSIIRIASNNSIESDRINEPIQSHDSYVYYARLDRIIESTQTQKQTRQRQLEFVRTVTNSRPILQFVRETDSNINNNNNISNALPTCQFRSDLRNGLLTGLQVTGQSYWTELVYEPNTYLLRDILIRPIGTSPIGSGSYPFNQNTQLNLQTSDSIYAIPIDYTTQLKRILYDRLFGHYCDLISASV